MKIIISLNLVLYKDIMNSKRTYNSKIIITIKMQSNKKKKHNGNKKKRKDSNENKMK